jgi:hypothetical protein
LLAPAPPRRATPDATERPVDGVLEAVADVAAFAAAFALMGSG